MANKRKAKEEVIDKNAEQNAQILPNNKSDIFWDAHPELTPIYMSTNKYMFYMSPDEQFIYKVCQRPMYANIDDFELKKQELITQIEKLCNRFNKEDLIEPIETEITDDVVWLKMERVRNIRTIFNPDNVRLYEWKEIKPLMDNLTMDFSRKYIKGANKLFEKEVDNDLSAQARYNEYIQYMNQLVFNFGIEFSNKLPRTIDDDFFPENQYTINDNFSMENLFLDNNLNIKFLDPKYKVECLEYHYAMIDIIADEFDNLAFGYYSRWRKYIRDIFIPIVENEKVMKNRNENVKKFYKALRQLELAKAFLLRNHTISVKLIRNSLILLSDLDVEVLSLGIINNSKADIDKRLTT